MKFSKFWNSLHELKIIGVTDLKPLRSAESKLRFWATYRIKVVEAWD